MFERVYADGISDLQSSPANLPTYRSSPGKADSSTGNQATIVDKTDRATTSNNATEEMVYGTLPQNDSVRYEYRIGTNDVIEIAVFQVEDLKHTSRVNGRGYISVPLLGAVRVAGMTVDEAEIFITQAYAKDLLQNPHVSLFVKEYESQKYTVEGEVKEPGVFPLKGPTTLLQALAMAKGTQDLAAYDEIVIFRANAQRQVIGYIADLEKIRDGEMEDPLIATNDIIVVPRAGDKAWVERITKTLRGFIGFGTVGLQ